MPKSVDAFWHFARPRWYNPLHVFRMWRMRRALAFLLSIDPMTTPLISPERQLHAKYIIESWVRDPRLRS